jgi:hypothetical protein
MNPSRTPVPEVVLVLDNVKLSLIPNGTPVSNPSLGYLSKKGSLKLMFSKTGLLSLFFSNCSF